MPKVTEQYLAAKKKEIVAAAIRVCAVKPAYEVTLRDVVRECGISTGGIYNYFASVDDIFVEILNQAYAEFPYANALTKIFESGRPAAEIIVEVFRHEGRMVDSMYGRYGKLMKELDVIFANDPERGMRMLSKVTGNRESGDFLTSLRTFIAARIEDGTFSPHVPVSHILLAVIGAASGFRDVAGNHREQVQQGLMLLGLTSSECESAERLMDILARILLKLLN
ncbi:MAG: TetR/AcrR family transcriptional regulator [Defluviitaleaceae bacterium]|nr:TetR/AcrR family transcriptional regulator [Defluviitaleaceae bacterium]